MIRHMYIDQDQIQYCVLHLHAAVRAKIQVRDKIRAGPFWYLCIQRITISRVENSMFNRNFEFYKK